MSTRGVSLSPFTTLYGTLSASFWLSENLLPMKRLMDEMVLPGLVTACLFAGSPTLISPPSTKAITDGVVLFPSAFGTTTGSLPSITATQELVVPKSIPIILPMLILFKLWFRFQTRGAFVNLCATRRNQFI